MHILLSTKGGTVTLSVNTAAATVSTLGRASEGQDELPWIEDGSAVAPKDARVLSRLFLDRLQVLEEGTREYQYARNTLIEMNLSLVRFAAGRFRNRGSGEMEDVVQVGTVGLIKAIDRFDLTREVEFTSFAIPYIVGEIKRFFRDTTWSVHVPRRLQELRSEIAKAKEHLAVELDRDPRPKELAAHLGRDEEEIIDGIVAANGYTAGSLDMSADSQDAGQTASGKARTLSDFIGAEDPGMERVEDLNALGPLMEELSDRERRIVSMRFGQELTQAQIGVELGVSQMQVSRLLTKILAKLRTGLVDAPATV
ncbi:SigB/SigF/SigG family RNA polymerase sigma factor [Streptomyces xanthochromogenes]|uniref:SigB/SigF/SigG family RNA polymerase sigma factor n=1 Tax=Streptomyces xanthochromogenes TaxID=67384 RepID=UPI003412B40E